MRRLLVVLHGCGGEAHRHAVGGDDVLHVAVGDGLRILRDLECVLHDGPLAAEVRQDLTPLGEQARREQLDHDRPACHRIRAVCLVADEALVGREVGAAHDMAEDRPVVRAWRQQIATQRSSAVR